MQIELDFSSITFNGETHTLDLTGVTPETAAAGIVQLLARMAAQRRNSEIQTQKQSGGKIDGALASKRAVAAVERVLRNAVGERTASVKTTDTKEALRLAKLEVASAALRARLQALNPRTPKEKDYAKRIDVLYEAHVAKAGSALIALHAMLDASLSKAPESMRDTLRATALDSLGCSQNAVYARAARIAGRELIDFLAEVMATEA